MFRYARLSEFEGRLEEPILTKRYQEMFLAEVLPGYCGRNARVLEVGAGTNVAILEGLRAREKWIADPYIGVGGSWQSGVPDLGPGYYISRCIIGESSNALPSDFFDVIFSSSVLEHIGQRAAGFDSNYDPEPPEGQEAPRRAFCAECLRILKPGGVTIHTIDHGARNVTYDANFRDAGFEPLVPGERVDAHAMMADEDALRQVVQWEDMSLPLPDDQLRLHSVLFMGYVKPEHAGGRWAELPTGKAESGLSPRRGPAPPPAPTTEAGAPSKGTVVSRAIARARRVVRGAS